MHAVGHNGRCAGATARANRNALFLGVADKVPDNQVVVDIPHPADNPDFVFQPIPVLLGRILIAFPEALFAQLPEVLFIGIPLGNRERGQVVFVEGKLQIAALGNFYRIFKSLFAAREKLAQLLFAFQVEFLGLEFHPVGLVHRFSRLDTQQHILHLGVFFAQIVGIVGYH